jgi:hypothetical protein
MLGRGHGPKPGPLFDVTSHSATSRLGQGELADIWRKTEKQRLKRLDINLKRRLSRHASAIKRKAVGASPMVGEATTIIPPLVSTMSEEDEVRAGSPLSSVQILSGEESSKKNTSP